jgi:hypothetical protein
LTLQRYDPPGFLTDFDKIPDQLNQWSNAVSGWFEEILTFETSQIKPGETCQYYNQLNFQPDAPLWDQAIVWNAFPSTLRHRFGLPRAMELADTVVPLTQRMDHPGAYFTGPQWEHLYYRPLDEYCEWFITRTDDGKIKRIVFSSEPPEYWQAMHGDDLPNIEGTPTYPTTGDKDLLVELYREYVSPDVLYEDLICDQDLVDYTDPTNPQVIYPKGSYNPYNKWNTTHGIMHLNCPPNSLAAEIKLGGDGTVLRTRNGAQIADPDALICCSIYGGLNRSSDPTIGSTVNELASLGFYITLRNPVGLYMSHIDLAGFAKPDGSPVDQEFFRVLRGEAETGLIEMAVFEVPESEGFTVSDLTIGGVPIRYAGQIAQHITVNLVGTAAMPGHFANTPVACVGIGCEDASNRGYLVPEVNPNPCESGWIQAFNYAPVQPQPLTAEAVHQPKHVPLPKHRTR